MHPQMMLKDFVRESYTQTRHEQQPARKVLQINVLQTLQEFCKPFRRYVFYSIICFDPTLKRTIQWSDISNPIKENSFFYEDLTS
jgi:hypothetical protein